MRKTKKYMEMKTKNSFLVAVERIKNDINGNPKYSISVFDKNSFRLLAELSVLFRRKN